MADVTKTTKVSVGFLGALGGLLALGVGLGMCPAVNTIQLKADAATEHEALETAAEKSTADLKRADEKLEAASKDEHTKIYKAIEKNQDELKDQREKIYRQQTEMLRLLRQPR